jgi:hypothetical protein
VEAVFDGGRREPGEHVAGKREDGSATAETTKVAVFVGKWRPELREKLIPRSRRWCADVHDMSTACCTDVHILKE